MVHKPKAVKFKVVAGYILLLALAACAVWITYTEILKTAIPPQNTGENKKILQISNTIASLYAAEASGRSTILTGSARDYRQYNLLIDSVSNAIEAIKQTVDKNQVSKFDSIQTLLSRKKTSLNEILAYRKKYGGNIFAAAIEGINETKDSIAGTIKPVKTTKKLPWQKTVDAFLTPKLKDSLSKLDVSNDSLAMAFQKVLSNLSRKNTRVQIEIIRKEQKLLEENRIISDQLRVILSSVEKEFLHKSYAQITQAQARVDQTVNTVSWIGAVALFLLIVFAWIIIRDLTNSQNYRKQLELLNRQNEELLRAKSILMATVTHDLQTPLGSIMGFHDLIKASGITPKQAQYLSNIRESADYIMKLVNDLLDFSKLENNRISVEQASFNVKKLIESTCKTLEPIALSKNIELNWDVDDALDANYMSDPYRLRQVLTNLVSNAIKFTPEGTVEVTGRLDGRNITIAVLDTGIGIAKEKHTAIFKEFTQAHTGIEKKFGGTGLGLTISSRILELLGGSITLESEEGQGSIFSIVLPAARAAYGKTPASPPKRQSEAAYSNLEGKKILIVDDDNVQLTLMEELLLNYPVSVTTAFNTGSVIGLLESEAYDLVLTDIQMPVMDGYELVRAIRSHSNASIAGLPVIALSGKRDVAPETYTNSGFTAHHPKPVQLELLIGLLTQVFDNRLPVLIEYETTESLVKDLPLYNLKSLSQFTNNDPKSLNTILETFIESAHDNCLALRSASQSGDMHKLSATAHKMIPMLKQMEVHSIASLLVPLEDMTFEGSGAGRKKYVDEICKKMELLCKELSKDIT